LINAVWDLKKTYLDGRALFAFLKGNIQNMSPKERATAFFVLNRITFSGTTLSGGYSQKTFEGRFTESSIERLSPLASLMFSTKITNIDYEEVLLSSGKDVIIYLDPPYYSATKSALYGKNGNTHKTFEHERFAQICKQCPHKWFITYDNCEYIRKLFSFANITEFEIMYGMRNTGQKQAGQKETELLISNFNLNLQDNLFTIPQALKVEGGE
jgi:DNA adenine methylase